MSIIETKQNRVEHVNIHQGATAKIFEGKLVQLQH